MILFPLHMGIPQKDLTKLGQEYPDAKYYLDYDTPFQLVMATILSAQTRDTVVNQVTPALYARFTNPKELAGADVKEIEDIISRVSYAANKAKYLKKTGEILIDEFGGEVPQDIDSLTKLSGVGKKTANAIQQNAFSKVNGIVVDTHVIRLSQRLGWTKNKQPEKIENDLMEMLPREDWKSLPHLLKNHGQKICTAKYPKCHACILKDDCPSAFNF